MVKNLVLVVVASALMLLSGCSKETTEVVEPQAEKVDGVNYGFVNPQLANHTIVLESESSSDIITLLFCTDSKVKYNGSVSGTFGLHEIPSSVLDINFTEAPHTLQLLDSYNGKLGDSLYDTGETVGVIKDSGTLDGYNIKSVYTAPRAVCK